MTRRCRTRLVRSDLHLSPIILGGIVHITGSGMVHITALQRSSLSAAQ
jgi:hypothetical protein